MGTETRFSGDIRIDPPLSEEEVKFLTKFSRTRRMLRRNGPYYVGGNMQGENAPDVIHPNEPPMGQPELYCHWIPSLSGKLLVWDGTTRFYTSSQWMLYLIQHFLAPDAIGIGEVPGIVGGHLLNGRIFAESERHVTWTLTVQNNKVFKTVEGHGTEEIRPHDYGFSLGWKTTDKYFEELFGIEPYKLPTLEAPWAGLVADQDTGRPTRALYIESLDGRRIMYYLDEEGKAHPAGTLEWMPPEESE